MDNRFRRDTSAFDSLQSKQLILIQNPRVQLAENDLLNNQTSEDQMFLAADRQTQNPFKMRDGFRIN